MKPFCSTPAAEAAFDRWRTRLEAAGIELSEADTYVLGLVASRETRLTELGEALAQCKSGSRRLRLMAQERLAAQDMTKALDLLERTYGGAVGEAEAEEAQRATGTEGADVLPFRARSGLGAVAQRIVAAVKARPLTKAQLRARVRGGQGEFLRGLREALAAGALQREGRGTKARPYLYRGGA